MQSNRWLRQALRRAGWQPQRQAVAVGTLGIAIALILGALYLSQVALESSRVREIEQLIVRRDDLERGNEELRVQIAGLKSLANLQTRAESLGFVPAQPDDIEYLFVDGYVTNRGVTVAPLEDPQAEPAPIYDETFGGWLQQQWDTLRGQFDSFNQQTGS